MAASTLVEEVADANGTSASLPSSAASLLPSPLSAASQRATIACAHPHRTRRIVSSLMCGIDGSRVVAALWPIPLSSSLLSLSSSSSSSSLSSTPSELAHFSAARFLHRYLSLAASASIVAAASLGAVTHEDLTATGAEISVFECASSGEHHAFAHETSIPVLACDLPHATATVHTDGIVFRTHPPAVAVLSSAHLPDGLLRIACVGRTVTVSGGSAAAAEARLMLVAQRGNIRFVEYYSLEISHQRSDMHFFFSSSHSISQPRLLASAVSLH